MIHGLGWEKDWSQDHDQGFGIGTVGRGKYSNNRFYSDARFLRSRRWQELSLYSDAISHAVDLACGGNLNCAGVTPYWPCGQEGGGLLPGGSWPCHIGRGSVAGSGLVLVLE